MDSYETLRNEMTKIFDHYHGYDPQRPFFQNLVARAKGHGKEGYERFLLFREITTTSPQGNFYALRKRLAQAYVDFYYDDMPSSRSSSLLSDIGKVLKRSYHITEDEIYEQSPARPIGADGGLYNDTDLGLLKVIEEKAQIHAQALNPNVRARSGSALNSFEPGGHPAPQ
ncbi:MAG: hypothetical protein K0R66_1197 [Gammaproteobacteria bacterium]|jgi:hypothetical protein|nr:hypothetical protein [Gammaproteobacteria bacterium]